MDFALFIVVTGLLFVRPGEFYRPLAPMPIYEIAILSCLLASFPSILAQLSSPALVRRPINACVIGMLVATMVSHLAHAAFEGAVTKGYEFTKVVVYYLLLVGVVNTPTRLRRYLIWLAAFVTIVAGLAMLEYHGVVDLPSFAPVKEYDSNGLGEELIIPRLRGGDTSALADPNDLCLVLVLSMMVCLYGLTDRRHAMPRRGLWLAPLAVLGSAFMLTKSRGGFLMLAVALLVLLHARYGWRKTVLLMGLALPLALRLGGRQTDISTSSGSGQQRIQIWFEGLIAFFHEPIFGIGQGFFDERIGNAAHNSYLNCYTELGVFGGTIFLGAFFCAIVSLYRLGGNRAQVPDPELWRLRPFLLGAVAGWAAGMLTLSESYIIQTYIVLGLAAAFAEIAPPAGSPSPLPLGAPLIGRVAVLGVVFMIALRVYVTFSVRWN